MKLDKYFKASKISEAKQEAQSFKGRETLVYITPRDFIKLSPRINVPNREHTDMLMGVIKSGGKFNDVPYLRTIQVGKGLFKVDGHEGRHRCMALMGLNVKGRIPVRIIDRDTRWLEDGFADKEIALGAEAGTYTVKVKLGE